jgi:N-acetylneuraminic acid mutarotase
MKAEKDK